MVIDIKRHEKHHHPHNHHHHHASASLYGMWVLMTVFCWANFAFLIKNNSMGVDSVKVPEGAASRKLEGMMPVTISPMTMESLTSSVRKGTANPSGKGSRFPTNVEIRAPSATPTITKGKVSPAPSRTGTNAQKTAASSPPVPPATPPRPNKEKEEEVIEASSIPLKKETNTPISTSTQSPSVATATTKKQREVHFLNISHLAFEDGFSASWLQSREDFMTMRLENIRSCEQASFNAYYFRQWKMRMTLDWMDWSVEHLSKWWKILEIFDRKGDMIPYNSITRQFHKYLDDAEQFAFNKTNPPVLGNTLAMIAFQPYEHSKKKDMAHNLTALSLATTVESLRRAGMGRVVVSFLEDRDIPYIQSAFKYLQDKVEPNDMKHAADVSKIGHMEVGFARASTAYTWTDFMPTNLPRATLFTLRDAMNYTQMPWADVNAEMTQNITAWLGTTRESSYWQYFYLTEPDTILQTRPSSLPTIKAEVDRGGIILPHRWQNLPHESDVKGMDTKKNTFLTEKDFPEVIALNQNDDVCCDENRGRDYKPGLPPYTEECKNWPQWYACGFQPANKDDPERHKRLAKYKILRLLQGTGITTIAGTNHGRRCIPKKNGVCLLPLTYDRQSYMYLFIVPP